MNNHNKVATDDDISEVQKPARLDRFAVSHVELNRISHHVTPSVCHPSTSGHEAPDHDEHPSPIQPNRYHLHVIILIILGMLLSFSCSRASARVVSLGSR